MDGSRQSRRVLCATATEKRPCEERYWSVCRRWRSSTSISDAPRQIFWIIKKGAKYHHKRFSICKQSFPTNSSRTKLIDCPELHDKVIHVSCYGYVLAFEKNNCSWFLLNHLTRRKFALPPTHVSSCMLLKIGHDSISNNEYLVVSMFNMITRACTLGFCNVGDDNWKTLELPDWSAYTYYNGMFFVCSRNTKVTKVINVTTGSLRFLIPPPEQSSLSTGFKFFVESCGKLLAIGHQCVMHNSNLRRDCFKIHELVFGNENRKWIKINGIGDQVLFLHESYDGMSCGGLSLKARDVPGFRHNCIYFLGHHCYSGKSYLVKFDISNASSEKLPFVDDVLSFFLPCLQ